MQEQFKTLYTHQVHETPKIKVVVRFTKVSKKFTIIIFGSMFCIGAAIQSLLPIKKATSIVSKISVEQKEELQTQVLTEVLSTLRDYLLATVKPEFFDIQLPVKIKPSFVQVITKQQVNLRKNPSMNADVLGVVSSGTTLLALSDKDGWIKVTSPMGEVSWVKKELVRLAST